jgi:hypothetical protein
MAPYVHRGARVPSVRRGSPKRPYFTKAAAVDLAAVLGRGARRDAGEALSRSDTTALLAFLDLS